MVSPLPNLVDTELLKKLLNDSYNESDNPFIQIVNKYYKTIFVDNIIIILIIVLILYIVYHIIKNNKKKQNTTNIKIKENYSNKNYSNKNYSNKKDKKKYVNNKISNTKDNYISDYYTKIPRVTTQFN